MTKNQSMLEKKLQELEFLLHDVVSLPPEDVAPRKHVISRDIELRIIFLKTLMAAEISSNPEMPENLAPIAGRLTELEDVFHRWNGCEDPVSEAEPEDMESRELFNGENVLTCSCTESCFDKNEDEEDKEKDEEDEWVGVVECGVKEEGDVVKVEEIREGKVGRWKEFGLVRVLALGFVVSFVGLGFLGGFQHVENECLMPT